MLAPLEDFEVADADAEEAVDDFAELAVPVEAAVDDEDEEELVALRLQSGHKRKKGRGAKKVKRIDVS